MTKLKYVLVFLVFLGAAACSNGRSELFEETAPAEGAEVEAQAGTQDVAIIAPPLPYWYEGSPNPPSPTSTLTIAVRTCSATMKADYGTYKAWGCDAVCLPGEMPLGGGFNFGAAYMQTAGGIAAGPITNGYQCKITVGTCSQGSNADGCGNTIKCSVSCLTPLVY